MRSAAVFVVGVTLMLGAMSAGAFTLNKRSGESVDFNTLIGDGRWTLIMVWEVDCVFCEQQKPDVDAFHRRNVDSNARVVGVALDGLQAIDDINKVVRRTPTRFPHFVVDRERFRLDLLAATSTQLVATPTYLLYSPDGQFQGAPVGSIDYQMLEDIVTP